MALVRTLEDLENFPQKVSNYFQPALNKLFVVTRPEYISGGETALWYEPNKEVKRTMMNICNSKNFGFINCKNLKT